MSQSIFCSTDETIKEGDLAIIFMVLHSHIDMSASNFY